MTRRSIPTTAAVTFLAACLALPVGVQAAPKVDKVVAVPGIETEDLITRGPDGNMWVALDGGAGDVARITPAGVVTRFDLVGVTNPAGVAPGPGGDLYVTYSGGVAWFDPVGATDPITPTTLSIPTLLQARAIVAGPGGTVWTASADTVYRITPPATVTAFPAATTQVPEARTITATAGRIWVGGNDGGAAVIAELRPSDGVGTPYAGVPGGTVQGLAAGAGSQIGFTDPLANPQRIGRLTAGGTPASRTTPLADPFGIARGADGAYWVAQFGTGNVGRLTAAGAYTTLGGFPAGAAKPRQLAAGPGGTVWVTLDAPGDSAQAKVARISGVVTPPPPKPPTTTITAGPQGRVTTTKARKRLAYRFTSDRAGAAFDCRLRKRGAARPAWRSCTSPEVRRVKPGRYTFTVRARAAGSVDPTPAARSVRVVRGR